MKKIASSALILIMLLTLSGCGKDKKTSAPVQGDTAVNVSVFETKKKNIEDTVTYTGEIKASSAASISAKASGVAKAVYKEIGDFVLLEKEPKSQKAMYELLFLFAEQKFGDAEIKNRLIYDYCCVHRDALSFMQADETLKSKAFEFLKKPERVTHYFEYYAGVKPVVLYKKIRFVPIGNRVIAFDYEHGLTVDVTTEIEQEETANV